MPSVPIADGIAESLDPVTEIRILTAAADAPRPVAPLGGFVGVEMNLNANAVGAKASEQVYLFFKRGKDESPITDIQVFDRAHTIALYVAFEFSTLFLVSARLIPLFKCTGR